MSSRPRRDTEPSAPAVTLRGVSFAYRKDAPVLIDCTLEIVRGSIVSILGQNGSGKTTLLKLIAGALRAQRGALIVRGGIAYVPQAMQISFAYSVLDVVLMGRARQIGVFATPSAADERAAIAALDRVGISALRSRAFDELSGGERQLVALARALATEAEILVLDEPMAALDLRHQQVVLQWIRRLAHHDGLTVVFSTHQPQHADVVADDAVLVFGPSRVVMGTVAEVLRPEPLADLFGVELQRAAFVNGTDARVLVPRWRL